AAVEQAEAIIETGVQGFVHWLDQRGTVPLIQALNAQADDWRAAEIARARKLLAKGEDVEAVLEALSRGLTQKMLHGALAELHATLSDPGIASDMKRFRELTREHAEVSDVVGRFRRFEQRERDLAGAREMLDDPDMAEMAQEEATAAQADVERLHHELQTAL